MRCLRLAALAGLLLAAVPCGLAGPVDGPLEPAPRRSLLGARTYKDGDEVPLWAAKTGPFANPSESYKWYDLPFCQPRGGIQWKTLGMGEVVDSNRMSTTPYNLTFKEPRTNEVVCNKTLSPEELRKFRDAVHEDYYYQMYYDDLPIWGFVGRTEKIVSTQPLESGQGEFKYFLFTHLNFDIKYNEDKVIEINLVTDPSRVVDISEGATLPDAVQFSYSVTWEPTTVAYEDRLSRYERLPLNPVHLEIHWFSIVNSCITVLLLTGFLATILLRVLRADFVKFSQDPEALADDDESGWKYVHGDVFRPPPQKTLFCAFVGTGTQVFTLSLFIFALALVGVFYPHNRGALFSALIFLYALTAGVAGYVASSYYRQFEGEKWVGAIVATVSVYCGPMVVVFMFLNTVAIAYRSTAALPFGTILILLIIWSLVTIPLTVFGGIAGKNSKTEFDAPCRTNKYPREIPLLPWYRSTLPQMAMAGFLPFSAIYVELYYIFASVWGHKVYIIWSILFIVYIILVIVTAFVTISLTYFQLAAEDHRWWWRSFLCGGSTALFVYGYCFYYYFFRSGMSGFMQTSFFFLYMAMACYAFFLMLGTIGWRASLTFVRRIFRSIHLD